MQTGKNAMASVRETAANIGASAKSGKEKTKAIIQEKVENMSADSQVDKEEAEKKKQIRVREAEAEKLEAKDQNAAASEQIRVGYHPAAAAAAAAAAGTDHRRSDPAVPGEDHHVEPEPPGVASSQPIIGLETSSTTDHHERPAASDAHNPADPPSPSGGI